MKKRRLFLSAILAPVFAATSTTYAIADPGSSVIGPHDGAPLGGSAVIQGGSDFFDGGNFSDLTPGQIIETRHLPYHAFGFSGPVDVVQIKFRTTNAQGEPTHGVTSVVKPPVPQNDRLVSFHSVYDSLDPSHSPSRAIQGDVALGTIASSAETATVAGFLANGTTVAITDIEGQDAHFAAGPEYGTTTLDALRAALAEPSTGLGDNTKIGLLGYSGGAIATNWAAQLAPEYAPEINEKLVGAATGGLLVNGLHNIKYLDGSLSWAGILPMTIVGLSKSYGIDLDPYLSDHGRRITSEIQNASISEITGGYGGITWASLVKPEYKDPTSIPELVDVVNKINLGQAPDPEVPFFIGQATKGELDGTQPNPEVGGGDGVMVAGDVRTVAHKICDAGNPVQYEEYPLPHTAAFAVWYPTASLWLKDRFDGKPAPNNCGSIAPGNDLPHVDVSPKGPEGEQELPQGSAAVRDFTGI